MRSLQINKDYEKGTDKDSDHLGEFMVEGKIYKNYKKRCWTEAASSRL